MILRQGDIILKKITNDVKETFQNASDYQEIKEETVVAYGEATGHHHKFSSGMVKLYKRIEDHPLVPSIVSVDSDYAILSHQEHVALRVPRGIYEVIREITYDPFRIFTQNDNILSINGQVDSRIRKYNQMQSDIIMRSRTVSD